MDKNITLKRILLSRTIIIVLLVFIIITSIVFLEPFKIVSANTLSPIKISGKVTDNNNVGLKGITVTLCNENGEPHSLEDNPIETKTDDDGEYTFDFENFSYINYSLRFTYGDETSLAYNGLVYTLDKITGTKTGYTRKANAQNDTFNFAFILPEDYKNDSNIMSIYNSINNIKDNSILGINIAGDVELLYNNEGISSSDITINPPSKNDEPIPFAISGFTQNGRNSKTIIVVFADSDLNRWNPLQFANKIDMDEFNNVVPIIIDDNLRQPFENEGLTCHSLTDTENIVTKIMELMELEYSTAPMVVTYSEDQGEGISYKNPNDVNSLANIESLSAEQKSDLGNKYWRSVTTSKIDVNDNPYINVTLKKGDPLENTADYITPDLPVLIGDALSGTIFKNENGTESIINSEIQVILHEYKFDDNDESYKWFTREAGRTENGKYGFDNIYDDAKKIKLEFTYGHLLSFDSAYNVNDFSGIINGQNYETKLDADRDVFNNNIGPINNSKTEELTGFKSISDYVSKTKMTTITEEIDITSNDPINKDLVLIKRPEIQLKLENEVNAVRYKLADGQVLEDERANGSGKLNDANRNFKAYDIQTERTLIHGSTIEIEYLLTITNNTEVDTGFFNEDDYAISIDKLINYLDFRNNSIVFSDGKESITEPETHFNNTYGWKLLKLEKANNNFTLDGNAILTNNDIEEFEYLREANQYLISTYLKDKKISANGGKETLKLTVSKVLSSAMSGDNMLYENFAEILEYSNTAGRVSYDIISGDVLLSLPREDSTEEFPTHFSIPGNPNELDPVKLDQDIAIQVNIYEPLGIVRKYRWWDILYKQFMNLSLLHIF